MASRGRCARRQPVPSAPLLLCLRCREMQQPKSATFREGIVDAMHGTQGAATDESPEADHPAYKYQVSTRLTLAQGADAIECT